MSISIVGLLISAIVIIFFMRGWKTGLIKSVFDLFSFLIVWGLTWILYPSVSALLAKTSLYDNINSWILNSLNNNDFISLTIPKILKDMPEFMQNAIVSTSESALQTSVVSIADALTILTINVISIIGLFIVLSILAFFVKKLGMAINKIIIIGAINKILGGIFGFIQGVLISYLIIMLISYFPTTGLYSYVARDMSNSYICKVMYNDNVSLFGMKPTYPVIRGE